MEWKDGKAVFRGIENDSNLSYTQNDTNITIDNYRGDKYIAFNSYGKKIFFMKKLI